MKATIRVVPAVLLALCASAFPGVRLGAAPPSLVTPDDPALGPASAPVTVVMFCDFQCPHCARTRQAVGAALQKRPQDVRFVYRDFPIERTHPLAPLLAEAAACAGDQGRYWEMWERLFAGQASLDARALPRHARALGLNAAVFDQCLTSRRHRGGWLADHRDGEALGVSGTPTLFINGQRVEGALGPEELDRRIASVLGR
jgi:protein-disulfide isomerase